MIKAYLSHKRRKKHYFLDNMELSSLCLPGVLFIFIFCYIPMFGIILAFKKYSYDKGIFGSPWVGLDNFKFFFSYPDAWRITRNTVGLNAIFISLNLFISITFAIMLNEVRKRLFIKVYQTVFFFPYFLSWVVVGYMFYAFFSMQHGMLNSVLAMFGINEIQWYGESKYWPVILTFTYLWKNVGYSSIIYYAGLMGINEEYYEAAKIDGASRFQMIRHITVPLIIPLITIMLILSIGGIFHSDFGMFFQLTRDVSALYSTTDVIDTYVYRTMRTVDFGMPAAVGLYQSAVGFILVIVTNYIVNRKNPENALF